MRMREKRGRFGRNVDVAFEQVNKLMPDALRYAGPHGAVQSAHDYMSSMLGNTPERYKNYKALKQKLNFLTDQLTQYLGSSVSPQIVKEMHDNLDSINAHTSPAIAKEKMKAVEELFEQERETYRKAATSPKLYTEKPKALAAQLDETKPGVSHDFSIDAINAAIAKKEKGGA